MKLRNTALIAALIVSAPAFADDLTVSAAASLKEAFQEINAAYQKKHPGTNIKLNTAASGVLLQQLAQGAPVDVLATADQTTMDKAQDQQLIDKASRHTFVLNDLVVVQPKDSRLKIKTLNDLKAATVSRIAVGNPDSVPAGRYTKDAVLAKEKVKISFAVALETPVSYAIAPTASAKSKEAKSYVDFVLSPAGQSILKKYGFSSAKGFKAK